jgi:putative metallohydrolase (TIGR04338 family)
MKDYQRNLVYSWENSIVAPNDNFVMSMSECQNFVEFVWANEGRTVPPLVVESRKVIRATGSRLTIELPNIKKGSWARKRWVLLHEISHAILDNSHITGSTLSYGHGPIFVDRYINLLVKYMYMSRDQLVSEAMSRGIRVAVD